MTEDEAKKKWCPMARVFESKEVAFNRYQTRKDDQITLSTPFAASCIGSGCMAWRVKEESNGYCGLAGKP